jgi:curved DNA-binding protein CbpA
VSDLDSVHSHCVATKPNHARRCRVDVSYFCVCHSYIGVLFRSTLNSIPLYIVASTHKMFRFALLGVPPSASEQEISSAYKKLALRHHPDKVDILQRAEATAKFQEIHNAYEFCIKNVLKGFNFNDIPGLNKSTFNFNFSKSQGEGSTNNSTPHPAENASKPEPSRYNWTSGPEPTASPSYAKKKGYANNAEMLPARARLATLRAELAAMEEYRNTADRARHTDHQRRWTEEAIQQMKIAMKDLEAEVEMKEREKERCDAQSKAGTQERQPAEAKQRAAWTSFQAQAERDLHDDEDTVMEDVPEYWDDGLAEDYL